MSKGDLLAVIDPAPYRAQFEQAQGQLQQNQAQLANAKVDLSLYQGLYAERLNSPSAARQSGCPGAGVRGCKQKPAGAAC